MFRISLVLGLMLTVSACTWVKIEESGIDVRVATAEEVRNCQLVGRVTSISRAKVAGITRSSKKLAKELETIARNEAADFGGNTVVPVGEIDGNEQTFQVYDCQ